jgi:hypothetical protein
MGRPPWLKWKGKPKDPKTVGLRHGFRSGLEASNADHLKQHAIPVVFEQVKIKYRIPESVRTYTPDFELPNGIIVETKGRFLPVDRAKHLFVKMCHPSLDIRFVFSNPNAPITKGAKTTLAIWAETHGYKWAKKFIPLEWAKEPKKDGTVTGTRTITLPAASENLFVDTTRQPHGPKPKKPGRRTAVAGT